MEGIVARSVMLYTQMKRAELKAEGFAVKLGKANKQLTYDQFQEYIKETLKFDKIVLPKLEEMAEQRARSKKI